MCIFIFISWLLLQSNAEQASASQTVEIPLTISATNTPILTICDDYTLLLDTGSDEFWLADHSCQDCSITASICPHITSASHSISYLKGVVQGEYAYLNTCGIYVKVFCIKHQTFMANLQANGVLGLHGQSTGKLFFRKFIAQFLSTTWFAIDHNLNSFKLILGQLSDKLVKNAIGVEAAGEWQIKCDSMIMAETTVDCKKSKISFDSGSSVISWPAELYDQLKLSIVRVMTSQNCKLIEHQELMKFICQNKPQLDGLQLTIVLTQSNYSLHLPSNCIFKVESLAVTLLAIRNDVGLIILGWPVFSRYIMQFSVDSPQIRIFERRAEVDEMERENMMLAMSLYLAGVLGVGGLMVQGYHWIWRAANRKIII